MKLTQQSLTRMLASATQPAAEQVVAIKPLGRSLRFKKDEWHQLFPDWQGIDFKAGKAVQIVGADTGGSKTELTDAVRERLGLEKGDTLCVTSRDDKFFLKKLDFVEHPAAMPGFYVLDSFTDTTVARACQSQPDLDAVTSECLDELLAAAGRFRYDPVAPFREMDGMPGYLARKEFAGGLTAEDKEWVKGYVSELAAEQAEDGSWQKAVPATAFNLTRLIDLGCTIKEPCVRKAVDWLLARPEPVGFPGLYMSSDSFLKGFNVWKAAGGKGRRGRTTPETDKKQFWANRDIFGVPDSYCEARFTWTNGVVLGALLKCGLDQDERVVRGINTLLNLSGRQGGWCGCGYFESWRNLEPDDKPVDFTVAIPSDNISHRWNWFTSADDIRTLASPWGNIWGLDVGDGRSLVVSAVGNCGDCSRVVLRGLSQHPAFRGSALETSFALQCIAHQHAHGVWKGLYLSFIFATLERCLHPLGALALLRSVPLLVRQQQPDGLWDESKGGYTKGRNENWMPPPTPAEGSFLILKALNAHNLLKPLLPQ